MGWERKRGKLEELNALLRGARETTFILVTAPSELLRAVRYVITLDNDTELPRGAAQKLVATIAHPLNRPWVDPREQRVIDEIAQLSRLAVKPYLAPASAIERAQLLYKGDLREMLARSAAAEDEARLKEAERQFTRLTQLVKEKVVGRAEVDTAEAAVESLKARIALSHLRLAGVAGDAAAAQEHLALALRFARASRAPAIIAAAEAAAATAHAAP